MQIERRDKLVAVLVVAIGVAALAHYASDREPADPCKAHPGNYACAVFAQPDWLTRRVYAGRSEGRSTVAETSSVTVEALPVSTETVSAPDEVTPDGV